MCFVGGKLLPQCNPIVGLSAPGNENKSREKTGSIGQNALAHARSPCPRLLFVMSCRGRGFSVYWIVPAGACVLACLPWLISSRGVADCVSALALPSGPLTVGSVNTSPSDAGTEEGEEMRTLRILFGFVLVALAFAAPASALASTDTDQEVVQESARPKVINAYVDTCPRKAARKGRCTLGAPIVRLTFEVPECWTVRPPSGPVVSSFAYTSVYATDCRPSGVGPVIRRIIVEL